MKFLIVLVAVLGVACAGVYQNTFKEAAESFVGTAGGFAKGAATLAGGATGFVAGGSVGLANGAAQVIGKGADVLFGFHQHGKAGYASLFQYYTNIGIIFHPNHGCCSCPASGVVKPGYPNYSSYSPFFINGVYRIDRSEFCTCPPELVASAVQAAHYNPGLLGNIGQYVAAVPQLGAEAVSHKENAHTGYGGY